MVRALEKEDSVYDFLYIDGRRLALFLSQFSQYGHLTNLTRSVNETASKSGGINLSVAKADTSSSEQTSQIRQFDAQWVAPLTFLDQVNQRGMLTRGLEDARIGSLVLTSGDLAVFDLAVIQTAWGLDHVTKTLFASLTASEPVIGNRHEKRRQIKAGATDVPPEHQAIQAAIDMLKTFPHAILATIRANGSSAWCSLRADGLIVAASDLMVKHGVSIAGSWNMVGVVDALPDDPALDAVATQMQEAAAGSLGSLGMVIGGMAPAVRGILGRPKEAFGMTPLLIFREVSG